MKHIFFSSNQVSRSSLPDLRRYRLVVFDLDGTLYRQGPVRRAMLVELLLSPTSKQGPNRVKRLLILRRFRHLREVFAKEPMPDFDERIIEKISVEMRYDKATLRRVIKEWMEVRPLRHLYAARMPGVSELFDALRQRGTKIVVWSDYPVEEKLKVLDLHADHILSSADPEIAALKPSPAGLVWLLQITGMPPESVLMIGDRDSRDGAAARACGVDFLLCASQGPLGVPRIEDFLGLAVTLKIMKS